MALGFVCQVLHQIHPFYSQSPDRKKHPHLQLKNQIPHPLQMHVWILHVVISQFPSGLHNRELPGLWEKGAICQGPFSHCPGADVGNGGFGVRPPEGRDPLRGKRSLEVRPLRGQTAEGNIADGEKTSRGVSPHE